MAQNPLEQLQRLSQKIELEERTLRSTLRTDFPELKEHPEEWIACLLLRALRMHLCLDLIDSAPDKLHLLFLRDWADAVDAVRKLSDSPEITGQVLSDTLDLVLLRNPKVRKSLLNLLGMKTRIKIQTNRPLPPAVVSTALDIADYCLETGRTKDLCVIIRNLIFLSELRNADSPDLHRIVVTDAIDKIVNLDKQLTVQLCESQHQYFESTVDKDACFFYWFYGHSVLSCRDAALATGLLKKCYDLCMAVEGETSWIGVQAGSVYHYSLLQTDKSAVAEAYLWETLERIDRGFYTDMDENADFVAAYTRSALLSMYFDREQLRDYLDDILKLLFYCVSAEETNRNSYLTVRWAENLLSGYHLEVGEPLLAATHAQFALDSIPPNGLPKLPSDVQLYTNLLQIYRHLHDQEQIDFYTQKLLHLTEEWENDPYLRNRINGLIFSPQSNAAQEEDDLEYNRQLLTEVFEKICDGDLIPEKSVSKNINYAWSVIRICSAIIDSATVSQEELIRLRFVMHYFWNRPEKYPFVGSQKLIYYSIQTKIGDLLEEPDTPGYLDLAWQYLPSVTPGLSARITFLRFAAAIYYAYGAKERSLEAATLLLSDVTTAWQHATTYFNDQRVCQVLSSVQADFHLCCAIMRCMLSSEELYEQILRFKDLPALVGRERNKLWPVDEGLLSGLRSLQDRLADAEMNDSLQGTDTAREIRQDLEIVEAGISAQFPEAVHFTEITFEGVRRKLPDNTAILEYYFVQDESSFAQNIPENIVMGLDIFVTAKANGQVRFHHIKSLEGMTLMEEAQEYADVLQDPDDLSASGRKAVLRASLYRKLISPVLPFLDGITDLYIAPDDVLCDVPFEILYGADRILLQNRYRICRLVSGRDLLFYDDRNPSGGSFILGGPNYEAQRGQRTQSRTRSSQGSLVPVDALPFSAVEARRIGRRCRGSIYTGDSATKYALRDALPCRIIHLATHGVYDENLETDSLYSSHLVFAGYNQWVRNQTESSHCGNGILTADEISRMDLKKTELVVLSACRSGKGDTSYGSVRGLLSAFSAAGARWVISHLWEASDFTTPILMDAFYDAFLKKGMDVPEALQYAKNYLKTITIGQLKRDCWLELPRDIPFPAEVRQAAEEMKHWPDWELPFQDEYYWGGFTVHKSR